MELSVQDLTKAFEHRTVLNGVSLSVAPGEVVGFVGPNGAGKSTTMKIVLGLMHSDSGTVRVGHNSVSSHRAAYLQSVAGIVDAPPHYPLLSARDHLRYIGRLRGLNDARAFDEALHRVGLSAESRKPVSRFSMGMKQRIAIAMALLQNPKFLILDEPSNGLDPAAVVEFRGLIRSLAEDTRIGVLISSHLLSEIERTCDRVVFIRSGRIVKDVGVRLDVSRAILKLRTTDDQNVAVLLETCTGVERVLIREDSLFVSIARDRVATIAELLVNRGIGLFELSPVRDLLEADYLREFQQKEMLS